MNGSFDVTIIGNGASGSSTLIQLLKLAKVLPSFSICIIGKINSFGKGDAFSDNDQFLLMNTPASNLSIIAMEKDHFVRWFNRSRGFVITGNYFPKRCDFAEYIQDTAQEAINYSKNSNVRLMNSTAIDIGFDGSEYNVITDCSNEVKSTNIVVATGNPPQENHYLKEFVRNYIPNPYPVNVSLAHIPENSTVAILGCSLSAVDVAIYLRHKNQNTKIQMFSRKGLLPKVKGVVRPYRPTECTQIKFHKLYIKNNNKKLSKYVVARAIRLEFKNNDLDWKSIFYFGDKDISKSIKRAKEGCQITEVLMAIQFELDRSWRYIHDSVIDWIVGSRINEILHNVAPIPMVNAEKIEGMINNGSLEVISGIEKIMADECLKITASGKEYSPDYIVNATGPARKQTIRGNFFLTNLVKNGFAKKHKLGGLESCPFTGAVTTHYRGIYIVGHPTFNTNPLVNNIKLITHNAFDMAVSIISSINERLVSIEDSNKAQM